MFGTPYAALVALKVLRPDVAGLLPVASLVNYYRYFVLGMMVRKYAPLAACLHNRWVYTVAVALFVAGVRLAGSNIRVLNFLAALGAIVALWHFFSEVRKPNPVTTTLALVGSHTLPIYLFHYFFLPDLMFLNAYLTTSNPFVLQLVACAASCAVIIPLCLFVESLVDKSPLLRLLLLGRPATRP